MVKEKITIGIKSECINQCLFRTNKYHSHVFTAPQNTRLVQMGETNDVIRVIIYHQGGTRMVIFSTTYSESAYPSTCVNKELA